MTAATTAGERAIALISAFDQSCDHYADGAQGEDIGGQAVLDIIEELGDAILDAENDEELEAARLALFGTVVSLVGILRGSLDHVDIGVDLTSMMQHSAQEAHRRAMTT